VVGREGEVIRVLQPCDRLLADAELLCQSSV
jgi:hypothetical protein